MSGRAARRARGVTLFSEEKRQVNIKTIRPNHGRRMWNIAYDLPRTNIRAITQADIQKAVDQLRCFRCCFFGGRVMNIPVVHEDGIENEFDVEMCCAECARKNYGWSDAQYLKVYQKADKGESIQIPDNITDENKFKDFVRRSL